MSDINFIITMSILLLLLSVGQGYRLYEQHLEKQVTVETFEKLSHKATKGLDGEVGTDLVDGPVGERGQVDDLKLPESIRRLECTKIDNNLIQLCKIAKSWSVFTMQNQVRCLCYKEDGYLD